MKPFTRSMLKGALVCAVALLDAAAQAQEVTAIDILLEPDATMLRQAEANNARLLKAYPKGFALDEAHRPHVTMIQCFVRTADLEKVHAAAHKALAAANVNAMKLEAFKYCYAPGGGIEFMRPWAEKVYGIPPEQVVGSSAKTKFELRDGKPVIVRLQELNFIDDKDGKPVGINQHIGRRPIAAIGNSDGDLEMLQWTASGQGPRFCLVVHHTDADREWACDRQSHIGRLDKALDAATQRGWTVIDMKHDWRRIFPFTTGTK
jgi:hypothetical protein